MENTLQRCRSCGRFDSRECAEKSQNHGPCESYLSWSDHWTKEMAAIERALHNTYVAAAFFVLLAAVTVLLPGAIT